MSIAVSSGDNEGALYIAFKTRIPSSLVVSIDAQSDPSTAREDLIDNAWNRWLVERCGDALHFIASGVLIENPKAAWKIIPLADETLGSMSGRWPQAQFAQAFERVKAIGSEDHAASMPKHTGMAVPISPGQPHRRPLSPGALPGKGRLCMPRAPMWGALIFDAVGGPHAGTRAIFALSRHTPPLP